MGSCHRDGDPCPGSPVPSCLVPSSPMRASTAAGPGTTRTAAKLDSPHTSYPRAVVLPTSNTRDDAVSHTESKPAPSVSTSFVRSSAVTACVVPKPTASTGEEKAGHSAAVAERRQLVFTVKDLELGATLGTADSRGHWQGGGACIRVVV